MKITKLRNNTEVIIYLTILVIISSFPYWYSKKAHVNLSVQTSTSTQFKVYWAGNNQGYSEKRSASIHIDGKNQKYAFFLTDLKKVRKLRIDPAEGSGIIHIKEIVITQDGYDPIRFSTLSGIMAVNDVEKIDRRKEGAFVYSSGIDPQLEVQVTPVRHPIRWDTKIMWLIYVMGLVAILFYFVMQANPNNDYVTYLLMFVTALILVMVGLSRYNKHPDEYVHIKAALYYEDHWLPPEICEPGTEHTYSVYGVSRLNSNEIVYLIAGKFSRLLKFIPMSDHLRLRLFNTVLFFILVVLSFKTVEYRFVTMVLLLSPQVWYIFSYFNSDAFSLFVSMIVCYQILIQESRLNRYLHQDQNINRVISCLLMGILFAVLLLVKKNFFILLPYIGVYAVILIYRQHFMNPRAAVIRMGIIIGIAVSLFGVKYALNTIINGVDADKKEIACREKLAIPAYNPNTPLPKQIPGIKLRARGVSLPEMFKKHRWGGKVFRSSFGVYGYTSISAPEKYYHFHRILGILFILFILFHTFYKTDLKTRLFTLLTIACCVLLISAALWKSWNSDFQAQGRYLLPIATLVGFQLHQIRDKIDHRSLAFFVAAMFSVSLYSFLFIGLSSIPK